VQDPESGPSFARSTFITAAPHRRPLSFHRREPRGRRAVFDGSASGLLLCYVVQHVRTWAEAVESEGLVTRKWTRADLIIAMQSYYITVERTIFPAAARPRY
jgi:hypothetical protein